MTKEESKKPKSKTHEPRSRTAHKKVFDVLPPGKAVASPNSRSVIVGHKPPVKDDQFVPGSSGMSGTSEGVPAGAASDSVRASSDSSASSVATESATTKSVAHARMVSDPSEKRSLLDGRKKLELKPAVEKDGAVSMAATDRPADAEAQGAPELAGEATATPRLAQPNAYENAPEHLADLAVEQMVETEMFDQGGQGSQGGQTSEQTSELDQPGSGEQPVGGGAARSSYSDVSAAERAANRGADPANGAMPGKHQTGDDILAETGPPDLVPRTAVVSTHHRRAGALQVILIFLLVLSLSVVALNFLLDAEIIETGLDLPHTDLIR